MTWLIIGYYLYLNCNKSGDSISSSQLKYTHHHHHRHHFNAPPNFSIPMRIFSFIFYLWDARISTPSKLNSIQNKKKHNNKSISIVTDEWHIYNSMIILLNVSFFFLHTFFFIMTTLIAPNQVNISLFLSFNLILLHIYC